MFSGCVRGVVLGSGGCSGLLSPNVWRRRGEKCAAPNRAAFPASKRVCLMVCGGVVGLLGLCLVCWASLVYWSWFGLLGCWSDLGLLCGLCLRFYGLLLCLPAAGRQT